MYKLLNSFNFEIRSRDQALNRKFLQNDLEKKYRLKHPLLKVQTGIRLRLMKHPFIKILDSIRLQNLRLHTGFRKFFTDPPGIDRAHPP